MSDFFLKLKEDIGSQVTEEDAGNNFLGETKIEEGTF
jgi:hypothetical protein